MTDSPAHEVTLSPRTSVGVPALRDSSSMAAALRARGIFCCSTQMTDDQCLELPPMPGTVMVHIVLAGQGVVTVQAENGQAEDAQVRRGDIALLPHGSGHLLRTGAGSREPLEKAPRVGLGGGMELLELGEGQVTMHAMCSALTLEHPAAPAVPSMLPRLSVVSPDPEDEVVRTESLIALLLDEATAARPGWLEVTRSLVDALALRSIRSLVASAPVGHWWSALRDERIASVLDAVHSRLGHPWSVQEMADLAHMSRSSFSTLFTASVGSPPMAWVTQYRMRDAHQQLRAGVSTAAVAHRLGYGSEAAFRRAFRTATGSTPGAVRRERRKDESLADRTRTL